MTHPYLVMRDGLFLLFPEFKKQFDDYQKELKAKKVEPATPKPPLPPMMVFDDRSPHNRRAVRLAIQRYVEASPLQARFTGLDVCITTGFVYTQQLNFFVVDDLKHRELQWRKPKVGRISFWRYR